MKSAILKRLKAEESEKRAEQNREKSNERWQKREIKKIWDACTKMMNAEIPPLHGQKVNGCKISVQKGKDKFGTAYTVTVNGKAFRIALGVNSGKVRYADDVPEQDFTDYGIVVRWKTPTYQLYGDSEKEFEDWITLPLDFEDDLSDDGLDDGEKGITEEANAIEEFREIVTDNLKRCARS